MPKPLMLLTLMIALCFVLRTMTGDMTVYAEEQQEQPEQRAGVTIYVEDQLVQFDQHPYVDQQAKRTLVPFRQIFEALGAEVWYDETTYSAMGKKDGLTIQLPIDQAKAFVNGREVCLDVKSQVVNGRTMVPLRFVGENLGCIVTPEGDLDNLVVRIYKIADPNKMLSSGLTLCEAKLMIELDMGYLRVAGLSEEDIEDIAKDMAKDLGTTIEELRRCPDIPDEPAQQAPAPVETPSVQQPSGNQYTVGGQVGVPGSFPKTDWDKDGDGISDSFQEGGRGKVDGTTSDPNSRLE